MTDTIKGEVLVPASRWLKTCDCDAPPILDWLHIDPYGDSHVVKMRIKCGDCFIPYEQELPQGVEGIEHGKV